MKQLIILLSFILFSAFSFAQNIVPNYSFEQDDSCPTYLNGNSYEYSLGCVGWGQATYGNPDYYNACDTTAISIGQQRPIAGVPYNNLGHQNAYQGIAYAGFNIYDSSNVLSNYKEYLITNIPALAIDTIYKVSIEISLADSSRFATDGIGVLFTTYGSPNQYTEGTLIATPQIDYTSYGVISDTAHWTTLTGTFVADSAYTSLIIGGFKPYSSMNIIAVNDSPSNPHDNAYYYIDAVVVEKLSTVGVTSIKSNITDTRIYPNPFTDHTTLMFNNPDNSNSTLTIFNDHGQIVQHMDNITSGQVRIERNGLPSGFYYYQLRNENNIVANGKLIIR